MLPLRADRIRKHEVRARTDRSKPIEALPDLEVEEGRFLALVPLERLAPGVYEAELVSRRDTWLGGDLPSWTVRRKVEFKVLP